MRINPKTEWHPPHRDRHICTRPQAIISMDANTSTARVCAWCPDKREADEYCAALGYVIGHILCPKCSAKN